MDFFSSAIELSWQTTRVSPGADVFRAVASGRIVGTSPPVHGVIEQSGAGSGQYDARSMWAAAAAGKASTRASARIDLICESYSVFSGGAQPPPKLPRI